MEKEKNASGRHFLDMMNPENDPLAAFLSQVGGVRDEGQRERFFEAL